MASRGGYLSASEPQRDRPWEMLTLRKAEWIVAVLLFAAVLFLLIVRTMHAGPLDRDECDALHLARMPRLADLLENLKYTAFPILFPASVRAYTSLFGTSDISLRYFGLAVGVLMLSGAWFHARSVNREVPLLLPALIGLNLNFLTTGAWVRGYGLGSVLAILAFIFTERLLLQPSAGRLVAAFLAYLASMQSLFFNGALVPATILAGAAAFLANGKRKWMWLLLCAAGVCALSYLPYLLTVIFYVSKWARLLQVPVSFGSIWGRFMEACGGPHLAVSVVWLSVVLIAFIAAVWRLRLIWNSGDGRERGILIFGAVAIPTCALAYFAFIRVAHNRPQERYYLALVCVIAVATDLIVANFARHPWIRLARVIFVIVAMFTLPLISWPKIIERQSNIDIVAARLENDAGPNDLIVVNPWWLGISFDHYYHGTCRWITVPEISDHRIHRYDLLQVKMAAFFPLSDVEQEVAAALKSRNRVWIVGEIMLSQQHRRPVVLTPAPDPKFGWQNYAYMGSWTQQLGFLIGRHAEKLDVALNKQQSVRRWENVTLLVAEGWRY